MNDPKGSLWRKWDLHVHTPESLTNNYVGPDPWERFLTELELLPEEFKVIGINDYIFLDGYKRVLSEKKKGRLSNIDLLLPVIELRLDKFGGSQSHLSKVNYHIIFSNELNPDAPDNTPDIIEHQFLNALSSSYILSPTFDRLRTEGKWTALPTKESLKDLGNLIIESIPEKKRSGFGDPVIVGFSNLCISLDAINKALESHYFSGKFVTAVGKTEWADIKWNDQSIADKKTIINGAQLVFTSVETIEAWEQSKRSLTEAGVNNRLLDCSDAHDFSDGKTKDRIGKCFTWIKADPTFEGLLQVLNEPDERVFIGETPAKLIKVRNNRTKYLSSLRIERTHEATLTETWFNNNIPLNHDLVAIIGNRGKGKSALTDIIGLLGNTWQDTEFTFLSPNNFRNAKENKAKHFKATITWESGSDVSKNLDDDVDYESPELVKYIPQNYIEKICNEIGRVNESSFDLELKKVIFSHVKQPQRLGKASLDDLINYKTSEANKRLQMLRQEVHSINEEIVGLESRLEPEYRKILENQLDLKKKEIEVHNKSKPQEVPKPESNLGIQSKFEILSAEIDAAKDNLQNLELQISEVETEIAEYNRLISVVDRLLGKIENLELYLEGFKEESTDDFEGIGIKIENVLQIKLDINPLTQKQVELIKAKGLSEDKLDIENGESLIVKKKIVEKDIATLQEKLDEPNRNYQVYLNTLAAWEKTRKAIEGSDSVAGTQKFYQKQLNDLEAVPDTLSQAKKNRFSKIRLIHAEILKLADMYRELYSPVQKFIDSKSFGGDKFNFNFEVGVVDTGFEDGFFNIVTHGVNGTFCGVDEGRKMLGAILQNHDFETESSLEDFLNDIMDALQKDRRLMAGNRVKIGDQLRKGQSIVSLYDFIFSLEYLKPRYSLRMGEKELNQLSPGERGAMLLIFYLLVDKGGIPLIIDQPEENLDNQTVYELIVPCIKEAKQSRQIIIVTHNPNLAVVCDAEQVIVANLDKKLNYQMRYETGSIENPRINKAILDILEGTRPAFDNRDSKYLPEGS